MTGVEPGPTLGIVGGGQLGRMLCEAAAPLGVKVIVLDPTPDPPAAPVARDTITADFDDPEGVAELAERADCLTYEIELADPDLLEDVSRDADIQVHPAPDTLRTIQDKSVQKRRLREAGVPVPEFRDVDSLSDLETALEELGTPAMLKARRGGYDGRGNVPIETRADAEAALDAIDGPAMVEAFVPFERELSVIGVRGDGETAAFAPGENIHEEEILRETVVPARAAQSVRERALAVAEDVIDLMEGRGVFGIELFEVSEALRASTSSSGRSRPKGEAFRDDERRPGRLSNHPREAGEILVNEIAPRPHNSGHWTIEGAVTSQFEQHVRGVLGWPLGATDLRAPTAMANVLGDVEESRPAALRGMDEALATPGAHLHWYGKSAVRPLRKMGHVTVTADGITGEESERDGTAGEPLAVARAVRDDLTFTE